jgi:hypothetical protein
MDDGDQYFEKKLSQIFFIVPHVNFKDGWQLMMSTWHHGCNYNGVAWELKMNCLDKVAIELQ